MNNVVERDSVEHPAFTPLNMPETTPPGTGSEPIRTAIVKGEHSDSRSPRPPRSQKPIVVGLLVAAAAAVAIAPYYQGTTENPVANATDTGTQDEYPTVTAAPTEPAATEEGTPATTTPEATTTETTVVTPEAAVPSTATAVPEATGAAVPPATVPTAAAIPPAVATQEAPKATTLRKGWELAPEAFTRPNATDLQKSTAVKETGNCAAYTFVCDKGNFKAGSDQFPYADGCPTPFTDWKVTPKGEVTIRSAAGVYETNMPLPYVICAEAPTVSGTVIHYFKRATPTNK